MSSSATKTSAGPRSTASPSSAVWINPSATTIATRFYDRFVSTQVLDLFLELAALRTPPGDERAAGDVVLRYLRDLGLEPDEDDCGPAIGSNMGNIYVRLEPTAEGTPIFLCAHL